MSSVASISAAAMVQVAARGALLVVAMSTAWAVRLLPMMAVMIATGSIFCFLVRVEPLSVVGRGSD